MKPQTEDFIRIAAELNNLEYAARDLIRNNQDPQYMDYSPRSLRAHALYVVERAGEFIKNKQSYEELREYFSDLFDVIQGGGDLQEALSVPRPQVLMEIRIFNIDKDTPVVVREAALRNIFTQHRILTAEDEVREEIIWAATHPNLARAQMSQSDLTEGNITRIKQIVKEVRRG